MNPDQLKQFREMLAAGKTADEKLSERRVFLRGWTGGVEFCERMLARVLGEPIPQERDLEQWPLPDGDSLV